MTIFLSSFVSGFALSAALIVAIGAQNLFVLRQGLQRRHVLPVVLFCAGADAALISAGVAGLGAVAGAIPWLTRGLAGGGALFLGWYGLCALRRACRRQDVDLGVDQGLTLGRTMAVIVGFTVLNPHVYLDTVLLLGAAGASLPKPGQPFFVLGAALASVLWFFSLGYGARLLKPLFLHPRSWRILDGVIAVIMGGLAVSLLGRALG